MKRIVAVRKDENLYFQGPFWIIADSFKDILKGDHTLKCYKFLSDYHGKYSEPLKPSKNVATHKYIWNNTLKNELSSSQPFNFYPRGRVSIHEGDAWIHLNSDCNIPGLIDKIITEYQISALDIELDFNDTNQGSHYDYLLPYKK